MNLSLKLHNLYLLLQIVRMIITQLLEHQIQSNV